MPPSTNDVTAPPASDPTEGLSFPRQQARTGRFTRGAPRAFTVAADGRRVWFLRSPSGTDPAAALWVLDVSAGGQGARRAADPRVVADPVALLDGGAEDLAPAERARRERAREGGAGIVGYATDRASDLAAFALSSRLFVATAATGEARELAAVTPVVDPRPSPDGRHVAYAAAGALHVVGVDGTSGRALIEPDGPDVSWGVAEFVAAEEMGRYRGFWWSPESDRLLVARVDEAPVQRWYIADPANPATPAVEHAYPAAGTPNADVRLAIIGLDGTRTDVSWDRETYEYLASASWSGQGPIAVVQSRDQRELRVLKIDPASGATSVIAEDSDPIWVELVGGVPGWCGERLVWAGDRDGWRRVFLGDEPITPVGMQVRGVVSVDDDGVWFAASEEATEVQLWHAGPSGELTRLSPDGGVHMGGDASGGTIVMVSSDLGAALPETTVWHDGTQVATIETLAQRPVIEPKPTILRAGERELRTAVLLPRGERASAGSLPVILDPYGGPHGQRVIASAGAFRISQWLADQGFAVVVADGRGTPGRGYDFERAVAGDLATGVLEDQVDALHAAAEEFPELDLTRVGITGWSFGGYLSALAVLRRPDVFHAAVAGAPVTDMRLYDTHYTERYLGHPDTAGDAYDASSLMADAANLQRPLMIIHGLADDNVVAAHTLRLSALLTAAGRPHTVLPLSGVTHMTPQEEVAENLLLLQVDFFRTHLGA